MKNRITLIGQPYDGIWTQAVMYFPTDKYLRESWYAVHLAAGKSAALDNGSKIELDKQTLDFLIDAPSHEELNKMAATAVKKGTVAGDMLAIIYIMYSSNMQEPSIKKAAHICRNFAAKTKYGDNTQMHKSDKQVRNAFKKYKTVAHLWAAQRLIIDPEHNLFFEGLPPFLAISAALLEFGTTFIPHRARPKEPILLPDEMWALPEGTVALNPNTDCFKDEIIKLLADYNANEYQ